jgi:hypothetical protein
LEIVDVYQAGAMHEVVASKVFHRAVAFGPTRRDANPKSVTARLKTDGQTVSTKTVEVDPARTVWTMARLVGAVDQQLRPVTGSLAGRSSTNPSPLIMRRPPCSTDSVRFR